MKLIDMEKLRKELQTGLAEALCEPGANETLRYTAGAQTMTMKAIVIAVGHIAGRIEQRLAELEAAPFQYDGPYEGGKSYAKNTFVTYGGSIWHCTRSTTSRPGDGPAWTLAVKRGRDAS